MAALIGTVFVMSLLGSLHCAGMCGAFVAFAVGANTGESKIKPTLHIAYNLGRLATYTLLGAVCGAIGAMVNLGGSIVGVQRLAAALAGGMLVIFGVGAALQTLGVRLPQMPVPGPLKRAVAHGQGHAMRMPPVWRATTIGLLTTLLPCGWLYAFAATAAGTASPFWGAATMAVFWAGTLPVLVAVGVGVQKIAGALGKYVPLVASIAIVAVGLFTIFNRITVPAEKLMRNPAVKATSIEEATQQIKEVDAEELPCCSHDDAP